MSGAPDYSNPFLASPVADFDQRPAALDAVQAPVSSSPTFDDGQLLTPAEQLRLASAPNRQTGTEVTVFARPVGISGGAADHMFTQFNDGQEQYIFRGGPNWAEGGPHWSDVHAQVDPATKSPDYDYDSRVLYRTFEPGMSARDAIRPAQDTATRINDAHAPYEIVGSNSNSVVGDFTQGQFGTRVGDGRTWGYTDHLVPRSAAATGSAPPVAGTYPMTQPIW
jgi:hypothetical protein